VSEKLRAVTQLTNVQIHKGRPHSIRGNQKTAGKRFERYIQRALLRRYGAKKFSSDLFFSFDQEDREERQELQPDGLLLLSRNRLVLVEVKLRANAKMVFQLDKVYGPILRQAFPQYELCLLGICSYVSLPLERVTEQPKEVSCVDEVTPEGTYVLHSASLMHRNPDGPVEHRRA
jgi:hypothetical protein